MSNIKRKHGINIFESFQEQEDYKLKQLAELQGKEVLKQLRLLINLAFGMHGFNPSNLPKKHTIKIVSGLK